MSVGCSGSVTCNVVVNPGFEDVSSTAWRPISNHNGTVNVFDTTHHHTGLYSAFLNATKTVSTCGVGTDCKDWVGAIAREDLSSTAGLPTLDSLSPSADSFSAWLYVGSPVETGMPAYSIHIGIGFVETNGKEYSIEYWYGTSDLTNTRYRIGDISTGYWFMMARNLTADIQSLNISNLQSTRLFSVWFGAYGNITNGERAWVDDVSVGFVAGAPSTSPAGSGLGLVVAAVLSAALVGGILYFRRRARPGKAQILKGSMKANRSLALVPELFRIC